MREIRGEAWELKDNYTYLALTTNGTLKKHKAAVMGRGIALQAKNKYRGLENEIGIRVYSQGNVVQKLNIDKLIMFPVFPQPKQLNLLDSVFTPKEGLESS